MASLPHVTTTVRATLAALVALIAAPACQTRVVEEPPPPAFPSGSVDDFLEEVALAMGSFDVELMSSLFLPPDDTPSGESRRLDLRSIRETWPAAREDRLLRRVSFSEVSFDDLYGVVAARMSVTSGGAQEVVQVEFAVVPSPDGLRIRSMRTTRG